VTDLAVPELEGHLDDVRLSISEVVTNAVLHGGLRPDIDAVRIKVGTGSDKVRITVEQPTVADVRMRAPRLSGEGPGGFGLHLLDRLADAWGYDPGPPGRVWVEFGTST
jgi:anti-sigma regulatory factor (Ser/Thr protein kinase)